MQTLRQMVLAAGETYLCPRGIHGWWVYQIGCFPSLYRQCRCCGERQYLEVDDPPFGWRRMPSSAEVLEELGGNKNGN